MRLPWVTRRSGRGRGLAEGDDAVGDGGGQQIAVGRIDEQAGVVGVRQEAALDQHGRAGRLAQHGKAGALETAASLQRPVILMHMQGEPRTMQANPQYDDVAAEVIAFLRERVATARAAAEPTSTNRCPPFSRSTSEPARQPETQRRSICSSAPFALARTLYQAVRLSCGSMSMKSHG